MRKKEAKGKVIEPEWVCRETSPEEEEGKRTVIKKWGRKASPIINVENKFQEITFVEKLSDSINAVVEVSETAVVAGYKKAETFVKTKEFKRDVEIVKKTTEAVASGLYRGFGKLVAEVKQALKEVRASEILMEDKDKSE
jgi:hypothetical protein